MVKTWDSFRKFQGLWWWEEDMYSFILLWTQNVRNSVPSCGAVNLSGEMRTEMKEEEGVRNCLAPKSRSPSERYIPLLFCFSSLPFSDLLSAPRPTCKDCTDGLWKLLALPVLSQCRLEGRKSMRPRCLCPDPVSLRLSWTGHSLWHEVLSSLQKASVLWFYF